MIQYFQPIKRVHGEISLPGDKSISHRALIFSAMGNGISTIENISKGSDVQSTLKCLQEIGVTFKASKNFIEVNGVGFKGFIEPAHPLNCGNSGTTARLLAGLLVTQNFNSILIGDQSLSNRPMKRLAQPLSVMGGKLNTSEKGTLPIDILTSDKIHSIEFNLSVPSAQIKSAVLIAGLHCDSETSVIESFVTRDHTERLLGLEIIHRENKIISKSSVKNYPQPTHYFIPGDLSSAAYLIVLALMSKNSELLLKNVSLNNSRKKFLDVLLKMGGSIEIINSQVSNNENYGDVLVRSVPLQNMMIDRDIIPSIIDEIPILAVAAAIIQGKFEIRNCEELRLKESDRIKSICYNLQIAGFEVEEYFDGFAFEGELNKKEFLFNSFGDHRIAMAFAVLSMLAPNGGKVEGFESVQISNPDFIYQLQTLANFG
ncbi:MAG: 3-phosphoshikimate 1-carboxyvinyltransferase [Ignavibacteriaceae bacterium]